MNKNYIKYVIYYLVSLLLILLGMRVYLSINNRKIKEEAITYFNQFPQSEANQSAIELDKLLENLNLPPLNPSFQSTSEDTQKLTESIHNFLIKQLSQTEKKSLPIPTELQEFLRKNQENIVKIREHILTSDNLSWDFNLPQQYQNNYVNTSSLQSMLGVQKILLLQILFDNKEGKIEEVNKTLEASFKLNQFLKKYTVLDFFASSQITEYQIALLRQINNLSPEWLTKLKNYSFDYQQDLYTVMKVETLMINNPLNYQFFYDENDFNLGFITDLYVQHNFRTIYNNEEDARQMLAQLDNCYLDSEFQKKFTNYFKGAGDFDSSSTLLNLWLKSKQILLNLELNEHIFNFFRFRWCFS